MNIKHLTVIVLTFFLLSNAFAQLNIEITTARGAEIALLYPDEVQLYLINVFNASDTIEKNIQLLVRVDETLSIIDGITETKEKGFEIKEMKPKEKKVIELKIKVLESALEKEKNFIEISYGINSTTNFTGTHIKAVPLPISVSFTAEKSSMTRKEENTLIVSIENKSNTMISNIKALILADEMFYLKEKQLFFPDLMQEEKTETKISFEVFEATGEREILLALVFNDENGTHEIQKKVKIKIEDKKTILYILITIIVVLIIIVLYLRLFKKKEQPKLEEALEEKEE